MSKINIFASVEDEFLKIAEDKGWVKEGQPQSVAPTLYDELNKPQVSKAPVTPASPVPWEPLPQSKLPQQQVAPTTAPATKTTPQHRVYKSPLIEQVQQVLTEAGYNPGGIDGVWGPNTSKAWNALNVWYRKDYGSDLGQTTATAPPTQENMGWLVERLAPAITQKPKAKPLTPQEQEQMKQLVGPEPKPSVIKTPEWAKADDDVFSKEATMPLTPHQKEIVTKVMKAKGLDLETAVQEAHRLFPAVFAPPTTPQLVSKNPYDAWAEQLGKPVDMPKGEDVLKEIEEKMKDWKPEKDEVAVPKPESTFSAVPEHVPSLKADDGMIVTDATFVVKELIVLANDLDEMGEVQAAEAIDQQLKMYKEAMDKLYDITGETGEKFIGTAHPGGPVMVPAKDEGGKVENILEQQKKDLEVVKKNPTGKHAELLTKLITTANRLDEEGDEEGAKIVDKTIAELCERVLPFVNRNSVFKATGSEDKKALVKKSQAEVKTILQNMVKSLEELEDSVQDQGPVYAPKKWALVYGGNQYFAKYDKFIVAAQKDLNKFLQSTTINMKQLSLIVDDINAGLMKIKSFYSTNPSLFEGWIGFRYGEWSSSGENLWNESYKEFKTLVTQPKTTEKTEIPSKSQPMSTDFAKDKELKNLMYNLDVAIGSIENSYETAKKAFGGAENVKIWIKMLNDEKTKAQIYDIKKLESRNSAIYNYLLPFLKRKGLKTATEIITLTKHADEFEEALKKLVPKTPEKVKSRVAPGKGVTRQAVGDPQIKALQEALLAIGISVGKRGADGFWGPDTASAYNKFINTHGGVERFLQPIPNPATQKHANRPTAILQKALQIVQYYGGKEKEIGASTIELGGGITVPLQAMRNAQTFVDHMQTTLGSRTFPPSSALQYLNELSRYVSDYEADMEGKQPGSVKKWQTILFNLTREFQKYERQGVSTQKPGSDLMDPWAKQKTFQYPWEIQEGIGEQEAHLTQKTPGTPLVTKQLGGASSPDNIRNALYQLRPDMFENANLFKTKAIQRGKSPEQYLKDLYAVVGKIGNAMDAQEGQIVGKFGEGEFNSMQTYLADINGALERLGDKLNTSLFEEKKVAPIAPRTVPTPRGIIPQSRLPHEAEGR